MADEILNGQQAVDELAEAARAVDVVPDRLPAVRIETIMTAWMPILAALESDIGPLASVYSAEVGGELTGMVSSLPKMRRATLFLSRNYQRSLAPTDSGFGELVREAYALRAQGFEMLKLLTLLGHVTREEESQIRAGIGIVDLTGDVEVLGHKGLKLWPVLEPLQALQADPDRRMTPEKLKRMIALAEAITDHTRQAASPEVDWRRLTIRYWTLTEQTWNKARNLAAAAYRHRGDAARADALVSLMALGR